MKQVVLNARKLFANSGGVYIALAVLLAVCSVSNEYFRNPQNLANITRQVSYSGIIALGMTFVIAAGGIDLAVGSLLALAGVLSILSMDLAPGSPALQLALAFATALGVGALGGANVELAPGCSAVLNPLDTADVADRADAQTAEISDLASPELDSYIGAKFAEQLRSDVELVEGVYDEFDREAYLRGELAPVFFGSAVNNFGVRELLECFVRIAPSPRPAPTATRTVEPAEPKMTGFVFKIHANMDPNHRDRIAFLKICSGTFERNHNYLHVRSGKQLKFSSPTAFMAEKKSVIDFAYPGDIVGLHDTGNFKIGDTFTEGEKLKFTGIPSFAPEQFRYIENADPLKFKQLAKGVDQLMDEGVAQLFVSSLNGRKIIGTVGALQFEVIQYRLEHEYNAACRWEPISIYKACWIESDNAAQLADFKRRKHTNMAVDKHGRDVFLADTSYGLALAQENFKDIRFHFTSEF